MCTRTSAVISIMTSWQSRRAQFQAYNSILRQWPVDLYVAFKDNSFTTTLSVLVSAVLKLSRAVKIPAGTPLYRGLGGYMDLPDSFFQANEKGQAGFMEWGFMSTTAERSSPSLLPSHLPLKISSISPQLSLQPFQLRSQSPSPYQLTIRAADRSVALQYSGAAEGRPLPTVLQIRTGAVDRGACVRDFSQYQGEVEYLWTPCCFLEQDGPCAVEVTASGPVRVVPVHVNLNLKTWTTEELLGRKKQLHLAAFDHLVGELRRELEALATERGADTRLAGDATLNYDGKGKRLDEPQWTVGGYLTHIEEQCREFLERHRAVEAEAYTAEDTYRHLVLEMAEVGVMARSKLLGWLEDPATGICWQHGVPLRTAHRQRLGFLARTLPAAGEERRRAAEELCRLRGLVQSRGGLNELGESSLMAAAADGRSPADLEALVRAGAPVDEEDPGGRTALYSAASNGHWRCVEVLAELGANVNHMVGTKRWTPLFIAAREGHVGCVRALVRLGADLDAQNELGSTAVSVAGQRGHVDCVCVLAAAGADVNLPFNKGETPVYCAAYNAQPDSIRALAAAGADLDRLTKDGRTAAHAAARNGHAACIAVLAALGARLDRGESAQRTPAHLAAVGGHAECLAALRALGVDVGAADAEGATPLDLARNGGHAACVAVLTEAESPVEGGAPLQSTSGPS
jgi:ankyrin repeat protein